MSAIETRIVLKERTNNEDFTFFKIKPYREILFSISQITRTSEVRVNDLYLFDLERIGAMIEKMERLAFLLRMFKQQWLFDYKRKFDETYPEIDEKIEEVDDFIDALNEALDRTNHFTEIFIGLVYSIV